MGVFQRLKHLGWGEKTMTIQECKEELGKRKDKGRDGDRNAGRGEEEKQ